MDEITDSVFYSSTRVVSAVLSKMFTQSKVINPADGYEPKINDVIGEADGKHELYTDSKEMTVCGVIEAYNPKSKNTTMSGIVFVDANRIRYGNINNRVITEAKLKANSIHLQGELVETQIAN